MFVETLFCLVNNPHTFSCILQPVRLPVIIVAYAIKRYLAQFVVNKGLQVKSTAGMHCDVT
jgi:hypothetical protein